MTTKTVQLAGLERSARRAMTVEPVATDNPNIFELAFSSETPVKRSYGDEILDHSPSSVRLDTLHDSAPLLLEHMRAEHVGVVDLARIDPDRVGRARVRFSSGARGQEIRQDVVDKIRTKTSVDYIIHDYRVEERTGQPPRVIITDWEPTEISIVAIPADGSVGFGRAQDAGDKHDLPLNSKTTPGEPDMSTTDETTTKTATPGTGEETESQQRTAPPVDRDAELRALRTAEGKRVSAIRSLADAHNLDELGREAVTEGWSLPQFQERALSAVGERNNNARAESKHDGELDLSSDERKRFSMVRLMDAIANPNDRASQRRAGFELEVSAEAQRGFGADFNCRGEFVPESLLRGQRDLSAGTPADGAELVATDLMAGAFVEVLRNASATMQAGLRVLPGLVGNVDIPRQISGAVATWISAEDGDATESEPQFDQLSLTPKDLACYTECTRRLLQQSTPAIEGIVRTDLASAQALGVDLAVLYGTGAAGQPTGIVNQAGVGKIVLAGADPTYEELVSVVGSVMGANAFNAMASWIIESNGWEALTTTPRQGSGVEGNFILGENGRIVGQPHRVSNQVMDEDYFFGVWSEILLGEWGGLEINVDPYTHSLKGKVRYIMFKTCDIGVRHPEAFCYANDTP